MHTIRFHAPVILAVSTLLAGIACSSSSDSAKDAAPVLDTRADGPSPRGAATDPAMADGPLVVADMSITPVDGNATDVPAADAPGDDQAGVDAPATEVAGVDGTAALEVAAGETGATAACTGEYSACGCGCCGGAAMTTGCYYPSRGQTISAIAAQDQAVKSATNCNLAGCSTGIHYVCCPELPAETAAAASYTAEWLTIVGGTSVLQVTKSGADCATVWFMSPGENYTSISAPVNWGVSVKSVGACGEAGAAMVGTGGVGTFTATLQGTICQRAQVSLHATVFALDSTGPVKAVRLDADNLFTNVLQPSSVCP